MGKTEVDILKNSNIFSKFNYGSLVYPLWMYISMEYPTFKIISNIIVHPLNISSFKLVR